jgi:SAM-dependent methyltransferase
MASAPPRQISFVRAAREWWKNIASSEGTFAASHRLLAALWEFVRDSAPERRRQRYGDADFDWDYRVNTTSGTVGWRDRLLGVFHSPYQPTDPSLFHEMIDELLRQTQIDLRDFTFIDLGSGKGRTLLMASDYPFRRIVGVELLPSLHRIAQENLHQYQSTSQKCSALEAVCQDARGFVFPTEPILLFLFNPFSETGLQQVIQNLATSLRASPRPVFLLYHNPLLEDALGNSVFTKIGGTHQYSLYAFAQD